METNTEINPKVGEHRSIASQFEVLTTVLTIFGPYRRHNPAEVAHAEESARTAKFTWKNLLSAYPFLLLLWYIFGSLIWAFNVELDMPFPFRLAQFSDANGNERSPVGYGFSTNRIHNVFTAFLRLVENVSIYWTSSGLHTWLNGLAHLEREFNSHFRHINVQLAVSISKDIKRWLMGYFCIPCVLWLGWMYAAVLPKISFRTLLEFLGHAWFFTYMYVIFVEPYLEDVKVFVMLQSLRKVYKRFLEAINQDVRVRNGGVTLKNIHFWFKYSTGLRRQVEQTGEYLKTQIMLSVCETISSTSVGIYLILRFSQSEQLEESISFIMIHVVYCSHFVCRLYVKTWLAEGIYSEERHLYEHVLDMEQDLADQLPHAVMDKLRHLRTYLRDNPAQLSLGNYLVLNKSFLIHMGIQCVTMLIAVAQFHTSYKAVVSELAGR